MGGSDSVRGECESDSVSEGRVGGRGECGVTV